MSTNEARCDWSDLPKTQCGHCQGVGPIIGRVNLAPPRPRYPNGTRPRWSPADDRNRVERRDWSDGEKVSKSDTPCRYVPGTGHYLREHLPACVDRDCHGCKPCTHDAHGNPVTHCRAKASCTGHLDHAHPRTCPRCMATVRANLDQIERLAALMPEQAIVSGLDSAAAMLAGPAANPADWQRRSLLLVHAASGIDDRQHPAVRELLAFHEANRDEKHPEYLLADWERMTREALGHREPATLGTTLSTSISYLVWALPDVAQDADQDFAGFASEVAACRAYLEAVLAASRLPERGAPCPACPPHKATCDDPTCAGCKPRLERKRAHWCDKDDCTREHDATGARDTWQCPRNRTHWWSEADYRRVTYEDAVAEGMTPRRGRMGS